VIDRWNALKQERDTSWFAHWQELSDNIQPRRSRFLQQTSGESSASGTGVNRSKRNDKLINSTPRWAVNVAAAGMMGGVTSPARPWLRTTTPDPRLAESEAVRTWLHEVDQLLLDVFARANIYQALHNVYLDLICFGTSVVHIEEDAEDMVRAYHFPVGQYALANSARQRVDTIYRELTMTVAQLVEKFGLDACSLAVRTLWSNGKLDTGVQVLHVVEPNRSHEPGRLGSFPFKSCWLEAAGGEDPNAGFLSEGGYEEFPALCPRWDVNGEDVYGSSPGMDALGDCKALQHLEKRYAKVVDKITDPPMKGPSSLLHRRVSQLPGDFTPVDVTAGGQTLEPALQLPPQALGAIETKIALVEQRIRRTFYSDLWLMFADSDRKQITATEIEQRQQEKMLQLGPVMERLQDELLDPLIDRVFGILLRNGQIPRPPQELEGAELKVEYISILTQAQKAIGIVSLERFAAFAANQAGSWPQVLDGVDPDKLLQRHASAVGVPPDVLVAAEKVAEIREARARQREQEAQAQAALMGAQTAQTMSQADTGGDNALTRILGSFGSPDAAAGAA
jgi:hypothetical protein